MIMTTMFRDLSVFGLAKTALHISPNQYSKNQSKCENYLTYEINVFIKVAEHSF